MLEPAQPVVQLVGKKLNLKVLRSFGEISITLDISNEYIYLPSEPQSLTGP